MSRFALLAIVSLMFISIAHADEAPAVEPERNPLIETKDKIQIIEQRERFRIAYYKPIYIIYGNPLTKVQFSFRAPIARNFPLNFAYSQVIFWELGADSKPFLDATYNPEFFYRWAGQGALQSIDFGIWEHNSNGKAGDDSRSYDQSYVRANYAFQSHSWVTQFSGKLKILYDNDPTNRDIYQYVSPLEFELKFLQLFDFFFDQSELLCNVRPGGMYAQDFSKGGYEIGLNFHFGGLQINPAFYVQYFRGYGETLLNYDKDVEEIRAGFMF